MAKRRMFSLDVVDTDHFLDLPVSAQALYFHLGMRADDDGFVTSPKKITVLAGCNADDLRILVAKGYLIPFESGVYVITHWKENNFIRSDRYRKTKCKEIELLTIDSNIYSLGIPEGIPEVNQTTYQREPQDRLGEDRLGEDRLGSSCTEPEQDSTPCQTTGLLIPLVDGSYYDVPEKNVKTWEAAYPAVDVIQEIKKMIAWCKCNPKRRKTQRGVNRFINNWLSKEQDKGGASFSKKRSENRFNNFPQRKYDYDSVEKALLTGNQSKEG